MTKKEFKQLMTIIVSALKRNQQLSDDISSIFKKAGKLEYNDDKYVLQQYICDETIINQLIDFAQQSFDDNEDTINWWIYDCDFGTNHAKWYDSNNEEHNCNTIDDLYDMLISNK